MSKGMEPDVNYTHQEILEKSWADHDLFRAMLPAHYPFPSCKMQNDWVTFMNDDKQNRRLAIKAPRFHTKTTTCSHNILKRFAYGLEDYVLTIMETYDQAALNFRDIRDILENNKPFTSLYGLKLTRATEDILEINGRGLWQCKGSGDSMRGAKFLNYRPSLIFNDDVQSDDIIYSAKALDKLVRWFYGTVVPLGGVDGKIWLVGTPMCENDLLWRAERAPEWNFHGYSSTSDGTLQGDLTWGERWKKSDFITMKKEYESVGLLDLFYREILCRYNDNELSEFKYEHLRFYDKLDMESAFSQAGMRTFTVCDPAGNHKDSDDTVITTVTVDGFLNHFVREITARVMDPGECIEEIARHVRKYSPITVGIEGIAYQSSLEYWATAEMMRTREFYDITSLAPTRSKPSRIKALSPLFKTGKIWFPGTRPDWYSQFREQYDRYPFVKKDDILDTFTLLLLLEQKYGISYEPKQIARAIDRKYLNPYNIKK